MITVGPNTYWFDEFTREALNAMRTIDGDRLMDRYEIPQADPEAPVLIRVERAVDELQAALQASGYKIRPLDADRLKALVAGVR